MVNLILIPRLLAYGSAISSLSTQLFAAIAQVILVQRIFKFKINYRFLLTLFSFIGGVILITWLSRQITITIPRIARSFGLAFQLHTGTYNLGFPCSSPATAPFPIPHRHPPQRQLIAGFIKIALLVHFPKISTFGKILIVLL